MKQYKPLFDAFFEGKTVQYYVGTQGGHSVWQNLSFEGLLDKLLILGNITDVSYFRIKPETIIINGIECEPPLKHHDGYKPSITIVADTTRSEFLNSCIPPATRYLAVYFDTPEAAEQSFNALVKPLV